MSVEALTKFILARLAEDEATAREVKESPWVIGVRRVGEPGRWHGFDSYSVLADRTRFLIEDHETVADVPASPDARHIVRWEPARVLAECEAKRRIVEEYAEAARLSHRLQDEGSDEKWEWIARQEALDRVVRLLVLPHADHPDFQPEWKP